ncbi:hypothetical protein MBLNU13_g08032t1 [Cladosporium sp. NU13]
MSQTVAGIEVALTSLSPSKKIFGEIPPPQPSTTTLPAGHRKSPSTRPLPTDIILDRDIEIPLRDGVRLRADVFRPNSDKRVPALMVWGPYGKTGSSPLNLHMMPGRAGVAQSRLSGYESFEGPDPAEWVPKGYAIVNVDSRGTVNSEGDIRVQGSAEGSDGHDTVEHIATLPWCNSSNPPHLKCIAPLEGLSDLLREQVCRGGIPDPGFFKVITHNLRGHGHVEDIPAMLEAEPVMNEYWRDKRVDFSKIKVPAYVLASYSTGLHTEGSLRCFEEMTQPAWLTIHDTQEWYDLYSDKRTEDLSHFFDRYLKGLANGWENTPRVRVSLLGYNLPNITNQPIPNWPHPQARYETLFLGSGKLEHSSPTKPGSLAYQSDFCARQDGTDTEELHFTHTFNSRRYLLGTSTATLYVSTQQGNDLDIYVQLCKADPNGQILHSYNIPQHELDKTEMTRQKVPPVNPLRYVGPTGMLRASRRAQDPVLSKPHAPQLSFSMPEPISPGEITELEIGIWAGGMIFEKGEKLVLKVSGHPMTLAEFDILWGSYRPANKGDHYVHFGGEHRSHLTLPLLSAL